MCLNSRKDAIGLKSRYFLGLIYVCDHLAISLC